MDNPGKSAPRSSGPRTLFWEVTNRCNLACEHCYNKIYLNNKKFTLSFDQGRERCARIIEEGFQKVVFLGGEPLADKHLLDYVELLHRGGVRSSISTNGTLLTAERIERMIRSEVTLVAVSLDSGDAVLNDRIRGAGTFDAIIEGLRLLAECRRNGVPRVAIACTLAPENQGCYDKLFAIAAEVGVVDIFFNKYMKVNESNLTTSCADDFLREMVAICEMALEFGAFYLYLPTMPRVADALNEKYHPLQVFAKEESCSAVEDTLLLADDGKVYPCSMARVEHPEYGVDLELSLIETIGYEPIQRFVKFRSGLKDSLPEICRRCDYQETCATRCALTNDQSKYHWVCEALEQIGASMGLDPGARPTSTIAAAVEFD